MASELETYTCETFAEHGACFCSTGLLGNCTAPTERDDNMRERRFLGTIEPEHVREPSAHFGDVMVWWPNVIGTVLTTDVGKQVWLVDGVVQVENDEQRDERQRRGADEQAKDTSRGAPRVASTVAPGTTAPYAQGGPVPTPGPKADARVSDRRQPGCTAMLVSGIALVTAAALGILALAALWRLAVWAFG